MVASDARSPYQLDQDLRELEQEHEKLKREHDDLREQFFALAKTVEGVQHLFIRAGEYQGKSRGRLPR